MIGKRQMFSHSDYVCREAESPTPAARPACAYPWNAGWPVKGMLLLSRLNIIDKLPPLLKGFRYPSSGGAGSFLCWGIGDWWDSVLVCWCAVMQHWRHRRKARNAGFFHRWQSCIGMPSRAKLALHRIVMEQHHHS